MQLAVRIIRVAVAVHADQKDSQGGDREDKPGRNHRRHKPCAHAVVDDYGYEAHDPSADPRARYSAGQQCMATA